MLRFTRPLVRSSSQFSTKYFSTQSYGLGSTDGGFEKDRIVKTPGEPNKREFTYFMLGAGRFIYASAARLALIKVFP